MAARGSARCRPTAVSENGPIRVAPLSTSVVRATRAVHARCRRGRFGLWKNWADRREPMAAPSTAANPVRDLLAFMRKLEDRLQSLRSGLSAVSGSPRVDRLVELQKT